jgi:hypothetical protein
VEPADCFIVEDLGFTDAEPGLEISMNTLYLPAVEVVLNQLGGG